MKPQAGSAPPEKKKDAHDVTPPSSASSKAPPAKKSTGVELPKYASSITAEDEALMGEIEHAPADAHAHHAEPVDVVLDGEAELHGAQHGGKAVQTWDAGAKGFASAAPAKGADKSKADTRNFTGVATKSAEQAKAQYIELKGGNLTLDETLLLSADDVAGIEPTSDIIRNVLKTTCKSSWNLAKHTLAVGTPVQRSLMRKLWEFRQWHHDKMLKDTKAAMDKLESAKPPVVVAPSSGSSGAPTPSAASGPKADAPAPTGLTKWGAAGSASLTSDIDVNLKGTKTEDAVKLFNKLFREDGWPYESGVVYDVNAYALDFMHTPGGLNVGGTTVAGKEGGRGANKEGGASTDGDKKKDADQQEVWSLVKTRLYMSATDWAAYKLALDPHNAEATKWREVELRFAAYQDEMLEKMKAEAKQRGVFTPSAAGGKTGNENLKADAEKLVHGKVPDGKDDHAEAEDLMMKSSNRLYEAKLAVVQAKRIEIKTLIEEYEALLKTLGAENAQVKELDKGISARLVQLREIVTEAALYSNEAFITDGAINHTVVGLQVGTKIKQTKNESMNAVNENLGDILKEISRHGETLGDAAFKSGKYIWRLADAARNMGFGAVADVQNAYDAGFKISEEIKKSKPEGAAEDYEIKESAKTVTAKLGVTDIEGLKAKVTGIAIAVTKKFNTDVRASGGGEARGEEVNKDKH